MLTLCIGSCASSPPAAPFPGPGAYELTIMATSGSRKGATVQGSLFLFEATDDDRSDATGEQVVDLGEPPEAWGFTTAEVEAVGVPVCDGSTPPTSNDAVEPGVLLIRDLDSAEVPVLLISTSSNTRRSVVTSDGCGVALTFTSWSSTGGSGTWREWGIVRDGRGEFELAKAEQSE